MTLLVGCWPTLLCKQSMGIPTLANMLVSPDLSWHTCAQDNSIEQHSYKMIEAHDRSTRHMDAIGSPSFGWKDSSSVQKSMSLEKSKSDCQGGNFTPEENHPFGQIHPSIAWKVEGTIYLGQLHLNLMPNKKTPQLTEVHFEKSFANQVTWHVKHCQTLYMV